MIQSVGEGRVWECGGRGGPGALGSPASPLFLRTARPFSPSCRPMLGPFPTTGPFTAQTKPCVSRSRRPARPTNPTVAPTCWKRESGGCLPSFGNCPQQFQEDAEYMREGKGVGEGSEGIQGPDEGERTVVCSWFLSGVTFGVEGLSESRGVWGE